MDEAKVLQAANNIVSQGYKAAGYEYVNIDDCWSVKAGRNNVTHQIMPNMTSFPDGIDGLAKDPRHPASIGYESIDAATFAGWGIDYLKYGTLSTNSQHHIPVLTFA